MADCVCCLSATYSLYARVDLSICWYKPVQSAALPQLDRIPSRTDLCRLGQFDHASVIHILNYCPLLRDSKSRKLCSHPLTQNLSLSGLPLFNLDEPFGCSNYPLLFCILVLSALGILLADHPSMLNWSNSRPMSFLHVVENSYIHF
jgi:hypothetical protein